MPRHKLSPFEIKLRQSISDNLKKYTSSMNQQQLSELTGIPASTLSGYFAQRSTPNLGTVQKIADALNVKKSDIDPRFDTGFKPETPKLPSHTYPYIPADISAGSLQTVDAVTDAKTITLPDSIVGKYAGDKDIRFMHINGESMNRVIPNGSLIGVKSIDDASDLRNGNIVVFSEDDVDYSVKRFYNNPTAKIYSFSPDSTDSNYQPIVYRYEDAGSLHIIGRVAVYVVTL